MLVGLVGKPNVGKSTFFKAATLAQVACGDYPFVTIKPNHGTAHVKTKCASTFFDVVSNPREGFVIQGWRFVPVDLMDVAGLVPGASEGQGMGSEFLDDLNQADVLIHVIDASGSTNERGESVTKGSYDPINDVKFLEEELDFWYLRVMKKNWEKFSRTIQQTKGDVKKGLAKQLSGLGVTELIVAQVIDKDLQLDVESPSTWTDQDLKNIATALRTITKPIIIAANRVDLPTAKENITRLKEQFPKYNIIPCSAESEYALREAAKHKFISYVPGADTFEISKEVTDKQAQALNYIKEHVLGVYGSTGVQQVLDTAVFDILDYIAIYPGGVNKLGDSKGNILPDCFLLKNGATALDFADRLHTDFAKNFIRAIDVKSKRTVGREHLLKSGDVVEIIADK
ncbi:MAG: ribosome-binding ATPase YchF (GTP1/OBG family) [Candidatus Woesearchaeota archaeon]|jgi:ribosome-binding ATPase YchF (GTP1/OBG family)